MKKDLCELVVIIDESGSMGSVVNDTIGGFNTFLETHQSMEGEALLTLVKFDTKYTIVHNGVNVKEVPKLDRTSYKPSGMTALLDAVGKTVDEVKTRIDNTAEEEKPEKVIFAILTDGEENSSIEYKLDQIKTKIENQTTEGWEFIFLGADQDAWSNARSMGVHNSVNFAQRDMGKTIKGMAYYSANTRMNKEASLDYFAMEENDLDKELDKIKKTKKDG